MKRYKRLTEVRRKFGTGEIPPEIADKLPVVYPKEKVSKINEFIGTDWVEQTVKEGKYIPITKKLASSLDILTTFYNSFGIHIYIGLTNWYILLFRRNEEVGSWDYKIIKEYRKTKPFEVAKKYVKVT